MQKDDDDNDEDDVLSRHSHVNSAVKHKLQKLPCRDENGVIDTANNTHKQKTTNDDIETADKPFYNANGLV